MAIPNTGALGTAVANDLANNLIANFIRGQALAQTTANKPLLKYLTASKKTFGGGLNVVSIPVKGVFMSDTAGFFQGYANDDSLNFTQSQNVLRVSYPWKELHAGLIITMTELKNAGVHIADHQSETKSSDTALYALTDLLMERLDDYKESWARAMESMLWSDGSQDAKAVPGVTNLLIDNPAVGITGGLDRATYDWWRNRALLNIQASEENQTLSKALRSEQRIIRKFGGMPNRWVGGSDFISALELEVQAKGNYTLEGFTKEGATDLGMAQIRMMGVGICEYEPELDRRGQSKYSYMYDDRRVQLYPMMEEENKLLTPERPYQYMIFLKSMTWTGAFCTNQLNANEVFSVS